MSGKTSRARRRVVATLPVLALAAAGLATVGTSTATAAPAPVIGADEYYMNYAAPRAEAAFETDEALDATVDGAAAKAGAVSGSVAEQSAALDEKYAQGNPATARQLAKLEAKSITTGKSPKALKKAKSTQEAKLLTILVEFNDQANDDFTDSWVPEYWGASTCKPGEVVNGPLHNNIPNPADYPLEDNNSMWVEDFSPEHFDTMLYTDEGITERVRPDLTGPDGKPGIDISGYTMKSMYEEMSRGAYTVTGEATQWVTLPHSEGWYGATRCFLNDEGEYEAGAYQGMQGHPDNPIGANALPIDAVAALAEAQPDFPWADYDIEDQSDRDGDGNYYEPDGVIDHVVLVHAGEDKSGGGGAEGTYALWAHSSAVAGGADIPGTDLKLSNYIVQPEDSGVGVFAHEYGHDLGLPDLYDVSGAGSSDVDFWDLMSSGSHSGPIFQSMPTHMGLWDKWVLGWADPEVVNPGDDTRTIKVGQTSRPKKGTEDGIKVNLPDKVITLAEPHSGEEMWYTGADQDWADIRLSRTIADVPADATLSMWNNYVIEEDWDYGFVEASTDGGSSWSELKVYAADGSEASTPDGYADPNGRMSDYGGKKYGLTGDSHGWVEQHVDLSAYAGQTIQVRLRLATDAAYQDRGWFADDFALKSGDTTIWSDDVESGENGWTAEVDTFVDTTGPGWRIDTGTSVKAQYYLVEWRNFDGFDEGLKYGYNSVYSDGAWKVEKLAYNAPGALVWYRDTTYGNSNQILSNEAALPSYGAKGGLLIVDSHFDPLQRTGAAADADPTTLNVMPSRAQSSNAAFGLTKTHPFTECFTGADLTVEYCTDVPALPAVSTFTDDQGWVPGFAVRPSDGALFYRDRDASVVVPSVGNAPYSVPLYYLDGTPATDYYGLDIGLGPFGSGDPADDGVGYGTVISVKKALTGNTAALIEVTPPTAG
ncbi:immune inhibitor A domain-containing protein [Agromyces bracchium]|uniref:M6 family metalloprotease domain-containing protein n=1 Tax=Agromyces bracchium TaxID=88376 RepID=A0A6I3M596_9MICO|nr:immune inhibitor A domain-containing protein [Agromyces bracchium]MTH67938.1 M6 family metalloprotease domain-containing protein [Agromyces bracchium]